MKKARLLFTLAALFWTHFSPAADIVALCIGNEEYTREEDRLDTPVNDATLMMKTLQNLPGGAEVIFVQNGTKAEIQRALLKFKAAAAAARLVMVYYSGHGTEDMPTGYDKPETFLLPVDVVIQDVDDLPVNAIPLGSILDTLKTTRAGARAVFLDCCRNGAPRATRALAKTTKNFGDIDERVKKALGSAVVPDGTLIAFAASPGRKAAAFLTDNDTNSPFTLFLTEQMDKSGANLFSMVLEAGKITKTRTAGRQVPYINYVGDASLITEVVLRPGGGGEASPVRQPTANSAAPAMTSPVPAPNSVLNQGEVGKVIEIKLPGNVVMKFCWCPPGSFMMGCPESETGRSDDEKQVPVGISKGFWMAQTEVTQGQWEAVMGSNPSYFQGAELPAETVSWEDAQEMVKKLNASVSLPEGWKYALPSDAQWEYACRAGTASVYHFGDVLNGTQANCDGDHPYGTTVQGPNLGKTAKVGSYAANQWGLQDMHGNVWEWCSDWKGSKLAGGVDPMGPSTGDERVLRGGSWVIGAILCSAGYREGGEPGLQITDVGFRLALVPSR